MNPTSKTREFLFTSRRINKNKGHYPPNHDHDGSITPKNAKSKEKPQSQVKGFWFGAGPKEIFNIAL